MITFITDPYIIDPLGIAYLSASLKRAGVKTELVLTSDLGSTNWHYPVIAYSVTTGTHKRYAEINRAFKEQHPMYTSIFGGPHCTFFPDFAKEKDVDFIFRGECFDAIVEFAKLSHSYRERETPNMAYAQDGKVKMNDLLPPAKVSALPFPDRALIYQYKRNRENPIKNVMCSFGCPMSCTYCYAEQFRQLGYPFRIRPVESVIEESARLVRDYPFTELIFFQDDTFPLFRKDWIASFCKKYGERVKIPFHIQIRIEMLTEDALKMLKAAGLHSVTFAVETADETARREMLNRQVADKDIFAGAKLLRKHKIRFRVENMLGIPKETLKSALATLDMNIRLKPSIGWASLYAPYPGTVLGEKCRKSGLIDMEQWEADFFSKATLKLENKHHIERLQKLFSLVCAIPQLRPYASFLTRIPFDYKRVYHTVKKILYKYRLYKI